MKKNNKALCLGMVVSAAVAFPAGWAVGNGTINQGLVKALDSVGGNLFGEENFGASVVSSPPPDDGAPAVQLDVASPPPDDQTPVLLNVFSPPPDDTLDPMCVAAAQLVATSAGIRVIINGDYLSPTGGGLVAETVSASDLLGQPPDPCRDLSPPPDDN